MPVSSVPQAHALAAKLPPLPAPSPDAPLVLIPSALRLNRDQESALMTHARRRKEELSGELGLRDFDSPNWHQTALDTEGRFQRRHLDTRHMALMAYKMNYDWRPSVLGGIFADSNLHVPITRRILQQVIARMINYFVGSTPYFSAYDKGAEDADLAQRLDRWLKHELDSVNDTTSRIAQGIERALSVGEAIFALSYSSKVSYYQAEKEILVDESGQPIGGADNDYIIKGQDKWVPQQVPVTNPDSTPVLDPATGMPLMQDGSQLVLKRDGVTPLPASGEIYKAEIIWRKTTVKEGPQADLLSPFDFLYPLNCASLDEADCTVHSYDEPLIQLLHRLQMFEGVPPDEMIRYLTAISQRLLPSSSSTPKAAVNKASKSRNEPNDSTGADRSEPQMNWDRYCLFFDALGDGNLSNILLIMTADGMTPLFYDYIENVTPDHRRPYRMVTVNKEADRAHGQGLVELFEPLQTDADLIFNRWNFSLSRAGVVVSYQPENVIGGDLNPDLEINGGETLRLKPGKTLEETIGSKALVDVKTMPLREMLEFIMQLAMNMSGIANVNDGQAVGLDTTKLATGVRNLEKSGQELTDKLVADLRPGIKDLLKGLMMLSTANLTKAKTFRFFNGDVGQLDTIDPSDVQGVELDVDLELTKYRGEQEVAQSTNAMSAGMQFYGMLPEAQQAMAGIFQQLMKAYGIKDPPGPMMMPPPPALPAPGAPPPAETAPPPAI